MTPAEVIAELGLVPHPAEGGYFVETYRSDEYIGSGALPDRYEGDRAHGTSIYYLLTPDSFSAMHSLQSDEVFHFYLGDPVEMLHLWPDGSGTVPTLGNDIMRGMKPQIVVPRGVWQGARLRAGGAFALMGTTVAPGFDFADFEHGQREDLIKNYPDHEAMITALTRV
ncbi:MAG: hypothetical protein C1O27_000879 [Chloroflexi bacterium]|jgi:predicted cupin superfamily sugar epimerase|nr:MAG: hypothetical protein C1O27_000879 [Chloroflexota bacterium]